MTEKNIKVLQDVFVCILEFKSTKSLNKIALQVKFYLKKGVYFMSHRSELEISLIFDWDYILQLCPWNEKKNIFKIKKSKQKKAKSLLCILKLLMWENFFNSSF